MKTKSPSNQIDFQSIFECVPGKYLILLPDPPVYTIVAVSNAYAAATLTRREQILSKGLFTVFPDNPEDANATGVSNLSASLDYVVKNKQPHTMAIQKYDIPSGDDKGFEERYWSPLNTPVMGPDGKINYIIHHVEDVTGKVLTEEALENQTAELKRTNAKLDQFVRISSHDLQEPLRKIRTFGGMLNKKCINSLDTVAIEMSTKMMLAAEKMTTRLDDLLTYTYLHKEMTFSTVDLQELFEEVKDDLSLLIEEKNARIQTDPLPVITGIRHQLYQLVFNLVCNALKFSKKQEAPDIYIAVKTTAKANTSLPGSKMYCNLTFTDNGIGFESHDAEHIFNMFERLQTRTVEVGTGMGLAFCKMVVENHGGQISAHGQPGMGARFEVALPIRKL